MSAESHRACMSAPIRNVVTENGGATVDQGFMVDHTHDDKPPATAESVQVDLWLLLRLLAIPAIVCAVLAAMVFFNKGIL